ncbi:GGDEF domain-containing response regulator [Gilvimarinus polysaccharolyticus]|uniref:GGDEF domain-containing response regulator n=1 Tax=Gilvimarinus polysaccharolyticus TaxID=863921 RepID=UPI00067341C4|nr:diguanylate cyclase [Gilvimarinus polysaccharolyticus]
MSSETELSVLEQLQKLRCEYAKKLPDVLTKLEHLSDSLGASVAQPEALQSLYQELHKLAGSAGSFGFDELSVKAREQELIVKKWLAGDPVAAAAAIDFGAAIRELRDYTTNAQQAPASDAPIGHTQVAHLAGSERNLIYLLEDDLDLAAELTMALTNFGYWVEHYVALADAEKAVNNIRPDFLIVDVMFSGEARTGPESIAALQKQAEVPLAVVFISARDDFDAYLAAVRAGAVGYFVKPLDIPQLVNCLESQLKLAQRSPYRVLIVDDDAMLASHYQAVLESAGMRVEVITDPRNVLDSMRRFHPELVLLDLNLPDCRGYEVAQLIRLNPDWLRVAIAYLSSESDEQAQANAVGYGGDDFLTKPISDLRLVSAVCVRAARSRQLSEAIDQDSLTGLLTHARIKDQVNIELQRAKRLGKPASVAMIDLDHFKKVNDTYGHAIGDRVIRALAQLLRQRLRQTDGIGRYGGEEFVVILPDCDTAAAKLILDDLRESFAAVTFSAKEATFNVTLSCGIASSGDGAVESLLEQADKALYRAKAAGRNRVCTVA